MSDKTLMAPFFAKIASSAITQSIQNESTYLYPSIYQYADACTSAPYKLFLLVYIGNVSHFLCCKRSVDIFAWHVPSIK